MTQRFDADTSTDQRPWQWSGAPRGGGPQRPLAAGTSLFIVPAGKVAVITTLGKVSGGSRLPGLNLKILRSIGVSL